MYQPHGNLAAPPPPVSRSRGEAGQNERYIMTLAIFILGLIAGSTLLLALFIWGAMDDMERLHDEDDGEWL